MFLMILYLLNVYLKRCTKCVCMHKTTNPRKLKITIINRSIKRQNKLKT